MSRAKPIVLIKIGGKAAADEQALTDLIEEMGLLSEEYAFVLVHGGGAEVSRLSQQLGLKPEFRDGIRMTTPEEMEIVDMVLAGKVNKQLVRRFHKKARAVGLSGCDGLLFQGESIEKHLPSGTRTGKIITVDPALISLLLSHGYIPVIASTSTDEEGGALNINADEAAFHIAAALPAVHLIFISDIPGIVKEGEVISQLNEESIKENIEEGVITGGMIPKVNSSLAALRSGVQDIIICRYGSFGDLKKLIAGSLGSRILPA
jgi:acetylglutamate kinase